MGMIPQNTRNLMNIRTALDPGTCTLIRSLIDKYQQPEYRFTRKHKIKPSTWSHLPLFRLPAINPNTCRLTASKASKLFSPFEISFGRPYRTATSMESKRGYFVALEYQSHQLSQVAKLLREDLLKPVEQFANALPGALWDTTRRRKRKEIMEGLDYDSALAHVTIASKLSGEESWKILKDLNREYRESGADSKHSVTVLGLELIELNILGKLPRHLVTESFPFEERDTGSTNLDCSVELPFSKDGLLARRIQVDGS